MDLSNWFENDQKLNVDWGKHRLDRWGVYLPATHLRRLHRTLHGPKLCPFWHFTLFPIIIEVYRKALEDDHLQKGSYLLPEHISHSQP